MVSTRSLFQTALVLVSAVAVTATPRPLGRVPSAPGAPSAASNHGVIRARDDAVAEDDAEPPPSALVHVTCLDTSQTFGAEDEHAAQLNICGGLGSVDSCQGSPKTTTGEAGAVRFKVTALDADATINIKKDSWVQCVQAARTVCSTGSLQGICLGGASAGDVAFTLELEEPEL